MNNYIEDKDAHDARIDNQYKTINKAKLNKESLSSDEKQKRLDWYEKNYGPYIETRGLKNWKNLFRKPTMRDLLILIILAGVLLSAWSYKHDIQTCQDTLENLPREVCEACSLFMSMKDEYDEDIFDDFNYSKIEFTNVTTE